MRQLEIDVFFRTLWVFLLLDHEVDQGTPKCSYFPGLMELCACFYYVQGVYSDGDGRAVSDTGVGASHSHVRV